MSMRIKRGDSVQIISGSHKGETAKVVATYPKKNMVKVEGVNIVKRHNKPSMTSPQGGIIEVHKPIEASKVALVHPTKKNTVSKVGYEFKKDGSKIRVYKQANNKEIDS